MASPRPRTIYWLAAVIYIADQALKRWAIQHNPDIGWSFLGLTFHQNTGLAFSFPVPEPWLLLITSIFISFLLALFIVNRSHPHRAHPIAFMLVGAASNLTDRVLHGATIDYIALGTTYVNLADITLLAAALILLRAIIFAPTGQT